MKRKLYLIICLTCFIFTIYITLFWNNESSGGAKQALSSNVQSSNKESSIEEAAPTISQKGELKIFKLDSNDIITKMKGDKLEKIKYIVSKLPITDLLQVKNILVDINVSNESKFVEVNKILEKRLSEKEYNEFKQLMDEYVDFKAINGELI
ncbi:MAG: hypothetical protein RR620_10865 [Clostridium sp.]